MGDPQVRFGFRFSVILAFLGLGLGVGTARALTPRAMSHHRLATTVGLPDALDRRDLGVAADHAVVPASLSAALARFYVPSFSRQTKLACSACHYQFPQLTPFGRMFKLNGYTLTGLSTIGQPGDSAAGIESLKLSPIPPVAAMVVTGFTQTSKAQPGTQNATVSFPQELSLSSPASSPTTSVCSRSSHTRQRMARSA